MKIIRAIRLFLKKQYDSASNTKLKVNFLNALPFWTSALITGLIAVGYAKLFSWAEMGTAWIYQKESWLFFIISPVCFFFAWWTVVQFSPYAKGSGIPQVSAAIELSNPKHYDKVDKLLSLRVSIIKILSSLIMVFGGGVIGREGPTIQIAASIFKKINDVLPAWYPKISRRNMLVTGAAAGLASAFNTPLGGIVFAIEELTKTHFSYFKSALLTGVIIAGLTALSYLGPYLYLGFPKLDHIGASILFIVLLTALVTGIAGSGMAVMILWLLKKKQLLKKNYLQALFVIVCGIAISAMGVWLTPAAFGSGKEIMVQTLFTDHKNLDWYIPVLRLLGGVISFSTGAAGGVFAPSLSAGASIGAVIAGWLSVSPTETNLIILCGMTGFLTGITRSPFTSSILVIEMTNSHDIIFYLMVTALAANLVSNTVSKHSFYDHLKNQYIREMQHDEITSVHNESPPEIEPPSLPNELPVEDHDNYNKNV